METVLIDTDGDNDIDVKSKLDTLAPSDSAIICVVYMDTVQSTKENVTRKWIPMVKSLNIDIPIMIICNSVADVPVTIDFQDFEAFLTSEKQCEAIMPCNARDPESVNEVFTEAQRIALFPGWKLIDSSPSSSSSNGSSSTDSASSSHVATEVPFSGPAQDNLRPDVESALTFIFRHADEDRDGHLSNQELNRLQHKCFTDGELDTNRVDYLKKIVLANAPDGVTTLGFNLKGFLVIWHEMLSKGRFETFWVILRYFGFNDTFRLHTEFVSPIKEEQGHQIVLTDKALDYLNRLYADEQSRNQLLPSEGLSIENVENMLSHIPSKLQDRGRSNGAKNNEQSIGQSHLRFPWKHGLDTTWSCVTTLNTNNVALPGFLALWHAAAKDNAAITQRCLAYLGYGFYFPSDSLEVQQRPTPALRSVEHHASPNYEVLVIGLPKSGRSSLIRSLLHLGFEKHTEMSYGVASGLLYANDEDLFQAPARGRQHSKSSKSKINAIFYTEHAIGKALNPKGRSDLILVTFDLSDESSLSQIEEWITNHPAQRNKIQLVGTKADLASESALASAKRKCAEHGLRAAVCMSSKDGQGLSALQEAVLSRLNRDISKSLVSSPVLFVGLGVAAVAALGIAAFFYRSPASWNQIKGRLFSWIPSLSNVWNTRQSPPKNFQQQQQQQTSSSKQFAAQRR